mgnify:CR=1 FL=1
MDEKEIQMLVIAYLSGFIFGGFAINFHLKSADATKLLRQVCMQDHVYTVSDLRNF